MEKIHIRNFMAIEEADIEINQAVLLIGEQASGKSTIAKLVYFFKTLRDEYIKNLDKLQSSKTLQPDLWAEIGHKFYRFFGSIQHLSDFTIEYWYSSTKSVMLYTEKGTGGRKQLRIEFKPYAFYTDATQGAIPYLKRLENLSANRDIFESSVYRSALEELNIYINRLFGDERRPVFIPAGRNMAVTYADFFRQNFYGSLTSNLALAQDEQSPQPRFIGDTYIMVQFLQRVQTIMDSFKGNTFETMVERISSPQALQNSLLLQKIAAILKGQYRHDESRGEIILVNDTEYVFLNNASTGQQESIRVLQDVFLAILHHENVFRVIEEPEAHLFPMSQKHLLELFTLLLQQTDSQVIFTTHSPYILSVTNNLLLADAVPTPKSNPFYLDRAKTNVYTIQNGKVESIINPQTGLIDQNVLDGISETLADELEEIYEQLLQSTPV